MTSEQLVGEISQDGGTSSTWHVAGSIKHDGRSKDIGYADNEDIMRDRVLKNTDPAGKISSG